MNLNINGTCSFGRLELSSDQILTKDQALLYAKDQLQERGLNHYTVNELYVNGLLVAENLHS